MYAKVLLCAVCLFFLTLPASAGASYNVHLKNGQTVEAESYTITGNTITLKYKTGKASFPKGVVKSITDKSGKVLLLSEPGKRQPKQRDDTAKRPTPAGPVFGSTTQMSRPRNAGQPGTKQDTPPTGYERDFYEGSWPEQRDYMKGKKNPFK